MAGSGRARPRLRLPEIAVRYVAEGAEGTGKLADVSRSGLHVRAVAPPRPGAIIALQFESPTGKLVDVRGQVRWISQAPGETGAPRSFGVRLHEPPREFRDFVSWALSLGEEPEVSS